MAPAASALVEVHRTDGYPVEGVDRPEDWLSPIGLLGAWVAIVDSRVVGHVAITRPSGEGVVELWNEQDEGGERGVGVLVRLFVLADARNRSIGKSLVRAAVNYAATNDLRLVLDVMVKDDSAIRLYERLGWRRIGRITHPFGEGQRQEALAYVSPDPGNEGKR
ncbi:GNAT family N-acetyltransferase [Streptomyces sp. NPDC059092]|uniref:GNAT family N-acetyltransferase n=1 Tax=Streptomyces sp. NPDC059092 TaxID=3346725 RepID=UPI003681F684